MRCVNFSQDGQLLVTGADDKTVKVRAAEQLRVPEASATWSHGNNCST